MTGAGMLNEIYELRVGLGVIAKRSAQHPSGKVVEIEALLTGPQVLAPPDPNTGSADVGVISTHESTTLTTGCLAHGLKNNRAVLSVGGKPIPTSVYGSVHVQPAGDDSTLLSRQDLLTSLGQLETGCVVDGVLSVSPSGDYEMGAFFDAIRASENLPDLRALKEVTTAAIREEDDRDLLTFQRGSFGDPKRVIREDPPEYVGHSGVLTHMVVPRTVVAVDWDRATVEDLFKAVRPKNAHLVTNFCYAPETQALGILFRAGLDPSWEMRGETIRLVSMPDTERLKGTTVADYLSDAVIAEHFEGRERGSIATEEIVRTITTAPNTTAITIDGKTILELRNR